MYKRNQIFIFCFWTYSLNINICLKICIFYSYNGCFESGRANSKGRKHRSKMVFKRREQASGVKKGNIVEIKASPKQSQAVQDTTRHVVSYSYNKSHTVLVEYVPDHTKDMFQVCFFSILFF